MHVEVIVLLSQLCMGIGCLSEPSDLSEKVILRKPKKILQNTGCLEKE